MPPSARRGDEAKAGSLISRCVRGARFHFVLKRILFDWRELLRLHTRFKQNGLSLSIDIRHSRN